MSNPSTGSGRRIRRVLRVLLRTTRDENIGFLAAAVAYYAFVSFLPLLLIGLAIGSAIGGDRIAGSIIQAIGGFLAPAGQDLVRSALTSARGRGQATAVSIVILLWSGLRLFRGLDAAFSRVYQVTVTETLTSQLRDALTVLGSISLAVVGIVLVAGVLPETLGNPADWILEIVTLPIVLAATMYPMYYRFPDVPLSPLEVLPGVAFAAIAWSLLVGVFQLYAMSASQFELYGILGGALLLVTWLYFAAIVIILGGVLNAVLAGRVGDALDDSTDRVRADGGDDGPSDARDTDIERLEVELDELRRRVEEKTVDRESLETDLQRYIRRRLRSGHARGWGPYLVLLYGVIMTIAAFVYLSGGWAVLAMIIIWLSTLGLYVLMLIVGVVIRAVGVPGELRDWLQQRRE